MWRLVLASALIASVLGAALWLTRGGARGATRPRDAEMELGASAIRSAELTAAPKILETTRAPVVEELGTVTSRTGRPPRPTPMLFSTPLDELSRRPETTVLHVRDRASGRELAPVLVALGAAPFGPHPGASAAAARDLGPSPVQLASGGLGKLHVRSPGYAWAQIDVAPSRGGERVVFLDPGGELEIVFRGPAADGGARLRVFHGTTVRLSDRAASFRLPLFEQELSGTAVLVDGLPLGSYRVAAQVGDVWRDPVTLGETTAEVVAGRRVIVSLALAPLVRPAPAELAGTLVVPPEWALDRFDLDFELVGTPRSTMRTAAFRSRAER